MKELFARHGHSLRAYSFSALDRYWELGSRNSALSHSLPFVWAETDADIAALARMFDELRFPGQDLADAAVEVNGVSWYFRYTDADDTIDQHISFDMLSLAQDQFTGRFWDSLCVYPLIRGLRDSPQSNPDHLPEQTEYLKGLSPAESWWLGLNPSAEFCQALMDGALILARYEKEDDPQRIIPRILTFIEERLNKRQPSWSVKPSVERQRVFLTSLLMSPKPALGLELLKAAGFVEELWPELAILDDVSHSKDFHPEGNVWSHTLETFRYRKTLDLTLSLGLLLHDVGKPLAERYGQRQFSGHAELGANAAERFLRSLGYDPDLIQDVSYLVKNHMLPAAIKRIPLVKTQEILESPLFPVLLELYRCDESSSFKGLDGYYESSNLYQAYLKHRRNPYRSEDGKKLNHTKKGSGHHFGS